jgi:hypothetical protein
MKGEYFNNADFTSLQLTRTDAQVNFDWGTGSPHASIGADTFSVRWSGVLLVPETGSYTFSTLNSDGVRLYINGVPAINQFTDQSTHWNDGTPIPLTEGQLVDIQMDYYENTGSAVAKLKWTGPSFAGDNGAIIGSQWLFDGTGMNRAPYAFAQSLTVLKNTSKAVTLTGSAGTLTYSVLTTPAHGTLSGTAPNLTYTPTANFIGPDSFTFKVNNGTTDSAPATVSIDVSPANTFSVNFYANGGLTTPEAQANLQLNPGMSAGLADWLTSGWANMEVPWSPSSPQAPATLTSNQGSTATFVFKDCRNGGPYNWSVPRSTLLGDGNGNLMDGHVNSTLDPGDGTNLFDMEVTGIPFAVYDVIFYIGANKDQYGDGTGVIKFNGGADRAFKLKPGAFDGTFTEMVNASTPGNYIVFGGVTGSSFTTRTWGNGPNGFNHIGPCGFQIREAVAADTTPPTLNGSSIVDDKSGGPVDENTPVNYTVTFSEDMDAGTVSAADFGNAGTSAVAIGTVAETSPGVFTMPVTPTSAGTLRLRVNAGAVLNDAAGNALVTTSAITDDTTITVTSNTAPVATPQNVSTVENTAKPITLTATDAEADPLTYTIVTQPAHGSLSGTAPSVTYTPFLNHTGADSFTFKVNDGTIDSATATVSITVSPVSQLTWGAARAITAASDIQGTGVSNLAGANFGITTGTTTIVPAAETATVDVEFKSLRSGQNVTLSNGINVAAAADWGNWGFAAGNSVVAGNFGTVLDSNLGIETGAPVATSANITLSGLSIGSQYQIQFFADSTGSNSQTISGGDPINSLNGQFITGIFTADATTRVLTVTRNTDFAVANAITIGTINTPPPLPTLVSIVDDHAGGPIPVNTPASYTVTFSADMDHSTVTADDFGNAGTSAITLGTVTETSPTSGIFTVPVTPTNPGTLQLRINAGAVLNDTAGSALNTTAAITDDTTITVTNTAPVANAQNVSTPEDTALPVTLSATDAEGNPLTYSVLTQPAHGTLGGTAPNVTYTPAANYSGPDSFTFKANDGLLDSAPATVSITVTAVNDAPVANAQSVSTAEDTAKAITLTASDAEGSALVYTVVTNPASGTLSGTAPNLTYTPAANYSGPASFTFRVSDGTVNSATAAVSITVTAVNDAPVATPQSVTTAHNTAKAITLAGTDAEGGTLTYTVVTQPSRGTLSGTAPNLTYTPTSGTSGPDSFTFKVNDGNVDSAAATVSITIALPLPWTNADIGTGMLAGSVTTSSGTFTQAGSGVIGSTSDRFNFLYQTLTGDGEIKVRISTLQNTGTSSRVGVMIRDTLATNSKSIFMGMTGSNAYRWVRRTTTGGSTSSSNSSTGTVPNTWVRLVRSGTTITAYKSTNGTSWTKVGDTKNTTFASTCYIGLAVGSGSNTTLNTSQFGNVTVTP